MEPPQASAAGGAPATDDCQAPASNSAGASFQQLLQQVQVGSVKSYVLPLDGLHNSNPCYSLCCNEVGTHHPPPLQLRLLCSIEL